MGKKTKEKQNKIAKRAMLDLLIKDYVDEVKQRVTRIENEGVKMIEAMQTEYNMLLLKTSRIIIETKMSDLPGKQSENERLQKLAEVHVTSVIPQTDNSKFYTKKTGDRFVIGNNNSNARGTPGNRSKMTRMTRRKGVQSKTNVSFAEPASRRSTRQSTRVACTPGWTNTPLITPKFNPRLPKTPGVLLRRPKAGEMIMSMGGSPLVNKYATEDESKQEISIPLGKGAVMQLNLNEQGCSIAGGELDTSQINQLKQLKDKLASMLENLA